MGILDQLFGAGGDDPRSQAMGLLAAGLMQRDAGRGLLGANQVFANAPAQQLRNKLLQSQIDENNEQVRVRQMLAQREQAALEQAARVREGIPALFRQPGMTGGAPVPQTEGGVPMFSKPIGVSPMQQSPGGFDVQAALRLGLSPEQITALAGLNNIGRQKVAHTQEVDDGKGGKMVVQLDEFGAPVGQGMAGYTAPVQVNQGDRVSFVKPAPGVTLGMNMSPEGRDASARGWASNNLARERFNLESGNIVADAGGVNQMALQRQFGKPEAGFRWKPDGIEEPIPGGSKDLKTGEAGAKAEQRRAATIQGAESVLKEIADAKGLVGVTTAGLGGMLKNIPATNARDLSAKLETIKANLGFDRLQQMRDQSPTGGALGAVAVQELTALQSTVASLDQLQTPKQVSDALNKIETHYTNWANTVRQSGAPQTGGATGDFGAKGNTIQSLPKTAPTGQRVRDTTTGKILKFNGMAWVEEK